MGSDNKTDRELIAWTIVGLAAILALYGMCAQLVRANQTNSNKARTVRVEKVRACTAIQNEAVRAFCIINGGAGEP